ncbi:hypothetical protein [Ralstonia mojiangensis]|uniref:Polysaccharide chain length determinant N-terminal domain-containing protein n=1 Tax=Ralstonia mojiangensis TaxID=2953895 RepID=A0ABT2L3W5_9RALS|nr:hypothetical protein [Ralstonia mojiangensis]MCO5413236.1 hypothetical protein [Ralstonia mojiangensis]MCT7297515.1 hypothetical protein [Ralstonia mojiangensis]MCT7310107.1 hypothetical protein [Ralstonia mojiangensis]
MTKSSIEEAPHMPSTGTDTSSPALNPIRLLAKSFKAIFLAGIVGAGVGLLTYQIVHPRWMASMVIQLGQVSVPDAKGSLVTQPLENQLTATERYNLPSLRLQVLKALGLPGPDTGNSDSDLIFKSMKATAGRSPNVINVEVSAHSRESAASALEIALNVFSTAHRKLFDQAVSDVRGNLEITQHKLAAAERDYARVNEVIKSVATSGSIANAGSRDVLASNTITLINTQVIELRMRVATYQDALGPLRTYPTQEMGPAYVPARPTTPSIAAFILMGAAVGLMLGGSLVLLRESFRTA